jgi:hypothetical protein
VILQGEARVINSYTSEIIPPGVEQTSRCSWESKEKKKTSDTWDYISSPVFT